MGQHKRTWMSRHVALGNRSSGATSRCSAILRTISAAERADSVLSYVTRRGSLSATQSAVVALLQAVTSKPRSEGVDSP
jgi:mevalonate pyrophosphate decarboxylase